MSELSNRKWDARYLKIAKDVSEWSKDPSTKVANALYNALYNGSCVNGSTIYVHGLPCCIECAKAIIQSGIKRVVYDSKPKSNWEESTEKALELFKEANVETVYIEDLNLL